MNDFLTISYFVVGAIFAILYLKSVYTDEGTLVISNFIFSSIVFLGGWFSLLFNVFFMTFTSSKLKEITVIRRKNDKGIRNNWKL